MITFPSLYPYLGAAFRIGFLVTSAGGHRHQPKSVMPGMLFLYDGQYRVNVRVGRFSVSQRRTSSPHT